MKNCEKCEYCEGIDYYDGTPNCTCEGGASSCPYNDSGDISKNEFKITLDIPNVNDYIKHTVENTVERAIYNIIDKYVRETVRSEIEQAAKVYAEKSLEKAVDDEIKAYMQKDITIGDCWSSSKRTLSRNDYLSECTAKAVESGLSSEKITKTVTDYCGTTINKLVRNLKEDINFKIKDMFDETTRKALSENVVTMLMAGDTYKKLSDSMGRILE
jgi:hypothetical protein